MIETVYKNNTMIIDRKSTANVKRTILIHWELTRHILTSYVKRKQKGKRVESKTICMKSCLVGCHMDVMCDIRD